MNVPLLVVVCSLPMTSACLAASVTVSDTSSGLPGVAADTIDLHGQFVEEAEEILEERIKYAKTHGQNHLHV